MMKLNLTAFSIIFMIFSLCSQENDRAGVLFGASVSPEFSYSLVSTSIEGSSGTYTNTIGALATDLQLGFSRTGKNIHSIHETFSWYFPTGRFLGALASGYSFVHYSTPVAPSLALGFEINEYFRLNGTNDPPLFPGVQLVFKTGYEFKKHLTCWIGYLLGFENYQYSFNKTTIYPGDQSNTIVELGKVKVNELVLSNRLQISLGYLFY
jgi:hypothetical protein